MHWRRHVARRLRDIPLLWLAVGCMFCTACGAELSPAPQPAFVASDSTAAAKPASCDALRDRAGSPSEERRGSGTATTSESTAGVKYDARTNTIALRKGANLTLAALSQALDRPTALKELGSGQWLLAANLRIERGAALRIAAPEVRWLKLRSDTSSFVSIKALGGQLMFSGVCVTSWDRGDYDRNYADGRGFVLARDGAQMTIRNSELSYLGYDADESYGVAWRLAGTAGEIVDSHLAYNYYGLYAYRVAGLVIRGNEVHHSVRYGIDPHTRSKRLLIEDNRSHHNGKHGIILAEGCSDSVIRNNEVHHNAIHGIDLYQRSNDNLVEGNRSYANAGEGIDVNDSLGNTIKNNTKRSFYWKSSTILVEDIH